MLWFINFVLHLFGWAIVLEIENNQVKGAYPARCKFRGFDEKTNEQNYKKITLHLQNNINELIDDFKEEREG